MSHTQFGIGFFFYLEQNDINNADMRAHHASSYYIYFACFGTFSVGSPGPTLCSLFASHLWMVVVAHIIGGRFWVAVGTPNRGAKFGWRGSKDRDTAMEAPTSEDGSAKEEGDVSEKEEEVVAGGSGTSGGAESEPGEAAGESVAGTSGRANGDTEKENPSSRSERKRKREKDRRKGEKERFQELSHLLSQIEPQEGSRNSGNTPNNDPDATSTLHRTTEATDSADFSGLTRIDLIGRTVEIIRRLHTQNIELRRAQGMASDKVC